MSGLYFPLFLRVSSALSAKLQDRNLEDKNLETNEIEVTNNLRLCGEKLKS
jgi:hypothetical protein